MAEHGMSELVRAQRTSRVDRHPEARLRISLVPSCNYSCFFCHNEGEIPEQLVGRAVLSPSDLEFVGEAAWRAGISAIKITGGEPLLYRYDSMNVADVVRSVRSGTGRDCDLSLTTNGQLLRRYATELASATLDRLTVSLHTLDNDRFRRDISRSGSVQAQLLGLRAARVAGLRPLKANVTVYKRESGGNLGEISSIVERLRSEGVTEVRLYRILWTPFLDTSDELQVSNQEFSKVVSEVLGHRWSQSEVLAIIERLQAGPPGISSLRFQTDTDFSLVLDAVRPRGTAWQGDQEGDYALRLSAYGTLKTALYGGQVSSVRHLIRDRDLRGLSDAIMEASSTLVADRSIDAPSGLDNKHG